MFVKFITTPLTHLTSQEASCGAQLTLSTRTAKQFSDVFWCQKAILNDLLRDKNESVTGKWLFS